MGSVIKAPSGMGSLGEETSFSPEGGQKMKATSLGHLVRCNPHRDMSAALRAVFKVIGYRKSDYATLDAHYVEYNVVGRKVVVDNNFIHIR